MDDMDSKIREFQNHLESALENKEMISPNIQIEMEGIPIVIDGQKKLLQFKLMTLDALLSEDLFPDYVRNIVTNFPTWDIRHYKDYSRAVLNLIVSDQKEIVGTGELILRDYFMSGGNELQDAGVVVLSNGSVLPAYQKKGIGTGMMYRAFGALKDNILTEILEKSDEDALKKDSTSEINKQFLLEAVSKDNLSVFADFRDPSGYLPQFILAARKYGFFDGTIRARKLLKDYAEVGFLGDNIIFFVTAEQFPHTISLGDELLSFNTRMNFYTAFEIYSQDPMVLQEIKEQAHFVMKDYRINPSSGSYTFREDIVPVRTALSSFKTYLSENGFVTADFGVTLNPLTEYEATKKLTEDNSKRFREYRPDPKNNVAVIRPMPPSVRAAATPKSDS